MRLKFYIIFFCLMSLSLRGLCENAEIDSLWQSGKDNYAIGNFDAAVESYLAIEQSGYESPALYYNIANSYYRMKDIGRAVLYYRRSLKLDPSGKDANENLAMARARCVDKIEKVPEFMIVTWIHNVRNSLSSNTWAMFALCAVVLALLLLLLMRFVWRGRALRIALITGALLILFAIVSFAFSFSLYNRATSGDQAVVVSESGSVKSAPAQDGNPIFILHQGTEIEILEKVEDWSKIEIADGRQGWIKNSDIEVI